MSIYRKSGVIISAALLSLNLIACGKKDGEGPAERTGKQVDKAVEQAGQAMEKAADSVTQTAKDAADKVKEVAKDATSK